MMKLFKLLQCFLTHDITTMYNMCSSDF
jgi:hypothetical protein